LKQDQGDSFTKSQLKQVLGTLPCTLRSLTVEIDQVLPDNIVESKASTTTNNEDYCSEHDGADDASDSDGPQDEGSIYSNNAGSDCYPVTMKSMKVQAMMRGASIITAIMNPVKALPAM
ncbi:hypothetical protein CPB97_003458, partial [Podila verticillata]